MIFSFFSVAVVFSVCHIVFERRSSRRFQALVFIASLGGSLVVAALAIAQILPYAWLIGAIFSIALVVAALATRLMLSDRIAMPWKLLAILLVSGVSFNFGHGAPPAGTVIYWLVDVVNKAFYALWGAQESSFGYAVLAAIESTLAGVLVAAAEKTMRLHMVYTAFNFVAGWWLYSRLFVQARQFPRLEDWRMFSLLVPLFFCVTILAHWTARVDFYGVFAWLNDLLWVGFLIQGLAVAGLAFRQAGRGVWILALPFVPLAGLAWSLNAIVALGAIDALTGFSQAFPDREAFRDGGLRRRGGRFFLALGSGVVAVGLASGAAFFGTAAMGKYVDVAQRKTPTLAEPPTLDREKSMLVVSLADGKRYGIDRYEYPNVQGRRPKVNVAWEDARQLCHERAGRLCSSQEWRFACSVGGRYRYMAEGYSPSHVFGVCNVGGHGMDVAASGSFPQCTNAWQMADSIGNAWEWVDDRLHYDFRIVVGGAWNTRDDQVSTCDGRFLVREAQYDVLDTRAFGFRCCYDLSPN